MASNVVYLADYRQARESKSFVDILVPRVRDQVRFHDHQIPSRNYTPPRSPRSSYCASPAAFGEKRGTYWILTSIAGIQHHDRKAGIDIVQGDRLQLVRQHDNSHDPNAIRILDKDDRILGFVPKRNAAKLAAVIDSGKELRAYFVSLSVNKDCPVAYIFVCGDIPEIPKRNVI
ncbi:HIRAN domain-containing protein [Gemmobacter nectariphilus]|uniref:HIRAN domain-containing protein n=1 Tax=Gemmobacter nectariphilus TaxID=220343 RepID=UPI000A069F6B|nr:HIRAN domain-containing protein [Gemmobacter nectariphilus]